MTRRSSFRPLRFFGLLILVLVAVVTPGCQFLQNEFFFFCPSPQSSHQQLQQDHQNLPERP